ncbi:MAG: polyphosphate polymerase domain-containing protein [Caldilineaceae bacterium]
MLSSTTSSPSGSLLPIPTVYDTPTTKKMPALPGGLDELTLHTALAHTRPIHLDEMKEVALLKRVEQKFVLQSRLLPLILAQLRDEYAVLEVAGQKLNRYRTLYFDTADFAMYHMHHNRAADRFKVRSRTYVESEISFLEVKHKTNKQQVNKDRVQTPELLMALEKDAADFVGSTCPYAAGEMVPTLWNSYRRITLVNKVDKERVTLDIDLNYTWHDTFVSLPGVLIAEVKQERLSRDSRFVQLMRQHRVRSTGFSKYCVGVSLIYPELKHNRFKTKHRLISSLMQGERHEYH